MALVPNAAVGRTQIPTDSLTSRTWKMRQALGAVSLALLIATSATAQVRWRSGHSPRSGASRQQVGATIANSQLRGGGRHLVVQFDRPVSLETRATLNQNGLELLGYLGDNAFFAAVSPDGANPAALAAVDALVDAVPIQVPNKLHATLARGQLPDWAVVPLPVERMDDPAAANQVWIAAYILFHADVATNQALAAVGAYRAVVRTRLRSVNGMVLELPFDAVNALASEDAVQYLEPALPPLEDLNNSNRVITQADTVQAPPYNLDGSGVTVLVYDGGTARATHVDFQGRLTARDGSGLSSHATHVSGTIGGAGIANPAYRGMAPGVTIESYGFEQAGGLQPGFLYTDPGDMELDYGEAINVYGAHISNNSIGTNTAPNGFPCQWEGDYGVTATVIDSIVNGGISVGGAPFRIVWANGNERSSGRCGTTYHTTAPPACAKNHVTVGALNSNDDSVTWFTSWGPTDDGRIKPDVSAPGCQVGGDGGVTSCSASTDTSYTTFCGTSMASPTVCGLSALLLQDFRASFPGQPDFRNSTLKALLAHNAQDIEAVGPDYMTGYGSVRIQQTIDFMRTGAFIENSLSQGASYTRTAVIDPGQPQLKATLAWDDVPGTPNVDPALVNDLDLRVFSPSGVRHFPWTLGGLANPAAPAVRTVEDHVNNIEQVLVDNPEPGTWTIEVVGFNVPSGPQVFSLVGHGATNVGTSIGFPGGIPTTMRPGAPVVIDVRVVSIGEALVPGSPTLHYRYDGGLFQDVPLTSLGGDSYQGTLPPPLCGDTPEFYFSAQGSTTGSVFQPGSAPVSNFIAPVSEFVTLFADNFETDQGWIATNLGAISGDWERGFPINDPTWAYDPANDSDGSGQCFLTQNTAGNSDVDNGAVQLTSPVIDMSAGNVRIGYDYYLYLTDTIGGVDALIVEIESNGGAGPWTEIARHDTNGALTWRSHLIEQADLDAAGVVLTNTMTLRFTTNDANPQSVNESGLDAFFVDTDQCGAVVGACCTAGGLCTVRDLTGCNTVGGTYQGDGSSCTPNPCPQPMGACCYGDGSCLVQTQNDCINAGGLYQGHDTTCMPNLCPQPTGACCLPDGSCVVQTAASCAAAGGTYQGDGASCFPNPCPVPTGACCDGQGSCGLAPANECVAQGGTFMGINVPCTPNPCPQPTGACCLPDGSCTVENQTVCGTVGGEYIGDGAVCDPALCEQPQAACCMPDGSCEDMLQTDCQAAGGNYQGFSVTCGMITCPPPPGACCLADGTCSDVADQAACDALGGVFDGAGTTCAQTVCPILPGACCYPDTSCTDEPDPPTCTALGGAFQGHGTDCLNTTCPALPGDCNLDGVVDLLDHKCFTDCLNGPMGGLLPGCDIFDSNVSNDIDLIDCAWFLRIVTGP